MVETFLSPNFYLTVLLCTGLCYTVDVFIISFQFNFCTSPADLLRQAFSNKVNLDTIRPKFDKIYSKIQKYYTKQDLKREEFLDKRRDEKAALLLRKQ